jgi:hypothetical protein
MGSPAPHPSPVVISDVSSSSPEILARVILRCRELSVFLDKALPLLPARSDTPFLYGQLDDALKRLQASLRPLVAEEVAQVEKGGGLLRRLAGKKPRGPRKKGEARYDLEGNAWTIPVTELVSFLSHSGKSGLLWITSAAETFVLEFSRGSLVHATSNAQPVAYRLGEILLEQKLIEQVELTRLIDAAKSADDMLGSYLVRSGRLRHEDLQRALAIQVQQLFHRLMDAENALYRFQEGAQLLRSYGLEVNITQLLLESARKKDEARQHSEEHSPLDEGDSRPASKVIQASEGEPASALPSSESAEPTGKKASAAPSPEASESELPSPASKDA